MEIKNKKLPCTLSKMAEAVIADYPRRSIALAANDISEATRKQYLQYNVAVDMAVDFLEPTLRDIMLDDVVNKRSYYKSSASNIICRNAYYRRRDKMLYNVAVALKMT